jgi:hypothetical protein
VTVAAPPCFGVCAKAPGAVARRARAAAEAMRKLRMVQISLLFYI